MKNVSGFVLGLLFSVSASAASLSDIDWLAGSWSDSAGMEEHLTTSGGGKILGMAKSVISGKLQFFEFFEIEENKGDLVFKPKPFGKSGAAEFTATKVTSSLVRFENLKNKFPKIISYELKSKGELSIEVEGTENGKDISYQFDLKSK